MKLLIHECLGCCCLPSSNVAWSMCAGHNICPLTDALRPWLNSSDRCAQPRTNNDWELCTSHDRYGHTTNNVDRAMCTIHDQCGRSTTNVAWMMSFFVGRHFFPKEHRAWLMEPAFSRRRCRLADAHTPRLIREGLDWCYLSLANIGFLVTICDIWCMSYLERLIVWHKFWLIGVDIVFPKIHFKHLQ